MKNLFLLFTLLAGTFEQPLQAWDSAVFYPETDVLDIYHHDENSDKTDGSNHDKEENN